MVKSRSQTMFIPTPTYQVLLKLVLCRTVFLLAVCLQSNSCFLAPPFSDTLFSLIIFIYVMVTFLYIFYAFCWREEVAEEKRKVNKEEEEEAEEA